MPDEPEDHDQRLKTLIRLVPRWALQLFGDDYLDNGVDVSDIDWGDKEVFLDPPAGEKRIMDLLARVKSLQPVDPAPEAPLRWKPSCLDLEVESRTSTTDVKRRLPDYYNAVRRDTGLPMLSVVIYTKVKLQKRGLDSIMEYYGPTCIFELKYYYVSLAAMNGLEAVNSSNLLEVSLVGLMEIPEGDKAATKALALQRIAISGENDVIKTLLFEAVETYLELSPEQQVSFESFMRSQEREEANMVAKTSFEKGVEKGVE